jgi:hypothetical protein
VAAALSVVLGAPSPTLFLEFGFPELSTLWLIVRQVLAPLVVVAAFAPAAFAADAARTHDSSPVGLAAVTIVIPLIFLSTALAWLRSRKAVNA